MTFSSAQLMRSVQSRIVYSIVYDPANEILLTQRNKQKNPAKYSQPLIW